MIKCTDTKYLIVTLVQSCRKMGTSKKKIICSPVKEYVSPFPQFGQLVTFLYFFFAVFTFGHHDSNLKLKKQKQKTLSTSYLWRWDQSLNIGQIWVFVLEWFLSCAVCNANTFCISSLHQCFLCITIQSSTSPWLLSSQLL